MVRSGARLGPFGFGVSVQILRLGSAVLTRRPRKVSRRKAQGSGFKGSGFRLLKVQSAVLAAQGLGFGVWGLGLKAEGSGFRLQGFRLQAQVQAAGLWAGFRLLGREPGQSRLRVRGFGLQTKADEANGHSIYYQRQLSNWPFYQANGRFMKPRQPVDNFIARRPFYRSIVLPVDHFIAPNGRFIKANKRFYQAKAARRPFYRP